MPEEQHHAKMQTLRKSEIIRANHTSEISEESHIDPNAFMVSPSSKTET